MIRYLMGAPITLVVAAIIGSMLPAAFPRMGDFAESWYDNTFPVVEMHGELVEVLADSITVHIVGRKFRGLECKYLSLQAFNIGADGVSYDASIQRIDRKEAQTTKPSGYYDIGYWRIIPRKQGAVAAQVYVLHSCDGRRVLTKVADVKLPVL